MASRRLILVPLALAVLFGLVNLWTESETSVGIDYFQYWAAGRIVREGLVPDLYAAGAGPRMAAIFNARAEASGQPRLKAAADFRKEEIQIASTPFLYALVTLPSGGDFEADFRRHRVILLACTLPSLLLLAASLGYSAEGALAFLAFVVWAFTPLRNDLFDGNVNGIQLALLTLYLFLQRRAGSVAVSLAAGAVLGLAVAFKPNLAFVPVALAILWIANGRYGHLLVRAAGAAGGVVVAVLASALLFGTPSPWIAWLRTLSQLERRFDLGVSWGNFGGARLLKEAFGVDASPILFAGVLAILALAVWMGRERRPAGKGGFDAEFLMVGVGPLVPILASGLAWPHYLVLALPLGLYLLRPRERPAWYPWAIFAALFGISSEPALRAVHLDNDYAVALGLAGGSFLLFVLACREAMAHREEGAP
ncbi:MAG: DUF2029 domain-containing protein [Acidobacteria bacterium]|nr:DUF2029 domain-containing protein [Acidobacteriota bacterium]